MISLSKKACCEYIGSILILLACIGVAVQCAAGLVTTTPLICAILLGAASGFVNLLMSVDLIPGFFKRIFSLNDDGSSVSEIWAHCTSGSDKIIFLLGCMGFVLAGSLFIYTAIAIIKGASFFAIFSYVAALLIGLLMIIQEVETWMGYWEKKIQSREARTLDVEESRPVVATVPVPPSKNNKSRGLWVGRKVGQVLCIGNVLVLSILFAYGLATVLPFPAAFGSAVGVGATIILATCVGGYCEYFFYSEFVPDFYANFMEKWQTYWSICRGSTGYAILGTVSVFANAGVNAGMYFTTLMRALKAANVLLVQWGGHSLFPIVWLHVISGLLAAIGGIVSFSLGADFLLSSHTSYCLWLNKHLPSFLSGEVNNSVSANTILPGNRDGGYVSCHSQTDQTESTSPSPRML